MTLTQIKRRVPANHPKRHGQHHRKSDHYIKAYWPYLPVFAVLGLGVVLNAWVGHTHHSVLGYSTNISSQVLLAETNGQRLSHNASALSLNAQLTTAAQAKANDMAQRNYWSHVTPDGKQPWSFVEASGYQYQAAGENLAYGFGSSDQVMTAWMHSDSHRANILNANYEEVGFATANVPDYQGNGPQTVVVAMYGQAVGAIGEADTKPTVLGTDTIGVSRLSLLSTISWIPLAIAAVCGGAIALFFVRHAFAWHKVLVRGEEFFMAHPLLDVFLVSTAVLALIISNAAGTIL